MGVKGLSLLSVGKPMLLESDLGPELKLCVMLFFIALFTLFCNNYLNFSNHWDFFVYVLVAPVQSVDTHYTALLLNENLSWHLQSAAN